MGTNYYLIGEGCESCGQLKKRHIGKGSAGWYFSLHVYPEEDINTIYNWIELFKKTEHTIEDEYKNTIPSLDMLAIITNRDIKLERHKIDGRLCIGNGQGTYDYFIGEFS